MAVRVVESSRRIVVRDNPFPFWSLYLATVASAVVVVLLAFHFIESSVGFVFAVFLAEIFFGLGIWFLLREPATVCVFDQDRETLIVARWYMMFRRREQYRLRELERAEVEELTRIDGSRVFRPVVRTTENSVVPLSVFWYAPGEYGRCRGVIDKINLELIFS